MEAILRRLGHLAAHRPRFVLLAWLAGAAPLMVLGIGVQSRLHLTSLQVPGTESQRAADLSREYFGDSDTLVVLLRGRTGEADRQGPRLAAALERQPGVTVLGPWLPGAARALRPAPDQSVMIVRAAGSTEHVARVIVPALRSDMRRLVAPPVHAYLTGYPDIAAGIHSASVDAVRQAELIAGPLLIIVLLLVFRSPIAAALPLGIGMTTIAVGSGVLDLVGHVLRVDALALNLMTMMGLALGVDYGLLVVSRFRQELERGTSERDAVLTATVTAGRTVFFAGLALACAMTVAFFFAPGRLIASGSVGVVCGVLVSVLGALTVLPALLALLGGRIDRWRLGSAAGAGERLGALASRGLRRPLLAAGLVLGLVAVLAFPALKLETGPPDPGVLPANSRERQDYETIKAALGPGWAAPYQVTVAATHGRITAASRLRALARWQRQLASRRDVVAVLGPAQIADRSRSLARAPSTLDKAGLALRRGRRDQGRLADGLARARAGVDELTSGLSRAAQAAGRIDLGSERASEGAGSLQARLGQASAGARQLVTGIRKSRRGISKLSRGAESAARAAGRIRRGLDEASSRTAASIPQIKSLATGLQQGGSDLGSLRAPAQAAAGQLQTSLQALDAMSSSSKSDPSYARAYGAVAAASAAVTGQDPQTGRPFASGYSGMDASLATASSSAAASASVVREAASEIEGLKSGLARLRTGSAHLGRGLARLNGGLAALGGGIGHLSAGGTVLGSGLARLGAGGDSLATGIGRVQAGAGSLEQGLTAAMPRSRSLGAGLTRMRGGVLAARISLKSQAKRLAGARRIAGIASSGYFVLAALDTARPADRRAAAIAINTARGGSAAQLLVVPAENPVTGGRALRIALAAGAAKLERRMGTVAGVGGPAAMLQDFDSASHGSLPTLVLALVIVTYLILVPVLRSVVLPLLAVLFNLLSVAAALGVLVVLFQGAAPLGGPGFVDVVMVAGIITVVFGLSIDYEVFLLTRIREGYELTGTSDGAIAYGLQNTAGVITGAALIMTGVFVAFALTPLTSLRQLGVGLTVAVLLDATLIRLILLPAAIRLCGKANWWYPRLKGSRDETGRGGERSVPATSLPLPAFAVGPAPRKDKSQQLAGIRLPKGKGVPNGKQAAANQEQDGHIVSS